MSTTSSIIVATAFVDSFALCNLYRPITYFLCFLCGVKRMLGWCRIYEDTMWLDKRIVRGHRARVAG